MKVMVKIGIGFVFFKSVKPIQDANTHHGGQSYTILTLNHKIIYIYIYLFIYLFISILNCLTLATLYTPLLLGF
jgi:hypothetical protein